MREWECPKNCPDRKTGCQNINTCKIYALRITRSIEIKNRMEVRPFKNNHRCRSVITAKGKAR